ncbi:DnaJ-class molecular chaperone [Aliiruegeria haliotis]|uniref:DnaJ-class molecular chaperone n=1 Tax=Aliiruegeria haliotis TaxID=1280846 RepID=A0A2T0S021_9RHOB|nr:J domain-containing protein [Aliiruegeria haliotis]PRY26781.1 DnaJ-class molecular chaperone [Aliiruegeria haliotis]
MSGDPYEALGLARTATAAEIKKAYRRIAKECHPDLNPGDDTAEERFKAASAAYDLLKDPDTRARFDKGEIDASGAERPERHFYREYTEQPDHSYYSSQGFEDFGDANDIFAEILRQRAGRGGRAGFEGGQGPGGFTERGRDLRFTMEVDFLDAVRGSKQRIALPTGEPLEVTIPEGTSDGQTIRLRGKGAEGRAGGARGDALVTLHVRPHKVFRRENDDIHVTLPITVDEAVLGGRVSAPTIDGPVGLNVPAGSSGGRVLRLRGRGAKGKAGKGDAFVELRIVLPETLDDGLRDFMQEWRQTHQYDPRKGMGE